MEKRLNVPFNCLKFHTIRILQRFINSDTFTITQIREFFKPCDISDDELRELENVGTVEQLWEYLIKKKIITMNNVRALKTLAESGVKSEELKREVEKYERMIGGKARYARLAMKIVLPLGIGLAVLRCFPQNKAADLLVLENLVLPPLVRLVKVYEGCVCFVVETTSLSSLKQLWMSYKDGSLKEKLKKAINEINEVRKLTNGTEIDLTVEIDKDEYREACWVLVLAQTQVQAASAVGMERCRRHSFSCERDLPFHDKMHLARTDWLKIVAVENKAVQCETWKRQRAEKQVADLREQVKLLKDQEAKSREQIQKLKEKKEQNKKKLQANICKKEAEIHLMQKVNEKLTSQCLKALSLSKSLEVLKAVKDACLDFEEWYHEIHKKVQVGKYAKKTFFQSIDEYHVALKYFEKCLNTILEQNSNVELTVYGNLGNVFHLLSDYGKAIECYEKVLKIAENVWGKLELVKANRNLGVVHGKLGNFQEAIKFHEKQLQIAKEMNDKMEEGAAYENLGAAYENLGAVYKNIPNSNENISSSYKSALEYYKKFLNIAEESQDLMRGYRNLGNILKQMEKYDEAILNYEECLKNSVEMKDKMKAYECLGETYEHLENYELVKENYMKYLELANRTEDKDNKEVANAHENLANAYRTLGKDDDALYSYKMGLDIAKKINAIETEANIYGNMEQLYDSLGKTKEAKNCQVQREKLMQEVISGTKLK